MEHTFKIEKELKITTENIVDCVLSCEAGGYDVEKLVSIVCDYLDAEADYMKYSLDARKELGLAPDSTLWIPSLNGSKAYKNCWWPLSNPCNARNAITDAGIIRIIPAG
jgi:hypothetical protein